MDLSEAAIGMLRQQPVPHARFVCGDFVSHTLHQPESYDYAYSRFTIHAINQKQERMLLGSMARALKPGGKFFIEVRSVHDPLYGKGEALERNAFFYDNHYRRFLVLDELTEALRSAYPYHRVRRAVYPVPTGRQGPGGRNSDSGSHRSRHHGRRGGGRPGGTSLRIDGAPRGGAGGP